MAGGASRVAFSPEGRVLASGGADGAVRLWDPAGGSELRSLPAFAGKRGWVRGLAYSPDGATLDDGLVKVWDPNAAAEPLTLGRHTDYVHAAAFLPDGYTLVSASHDRTLRLWNLASDRPPAMLQRHTGTITGIAAHPDGHSVASLTEGHGTVRLWVWDVRADPPTAPVIRVHASRPQVLPRPAFSPEGHHLAVPLPNGTVWILRPFARTPGE